jgi:hypothetical protein
MAGVRLDGEEGFESLYLVGLDSCESWSCLLHVYSQDLVLIPFSIFRFPPLAAIQASRRRYLTNVGNAIPGLSCQRQR